MREIKTERKFVRTNYKSHFNGRIQVHACAERNLIKTITGGTQKLRKVPRPLKIHFKPSFKGRTAIWQLKARFKFQFQLHIFRSMTHYYPIDSKKGLFFMQSLYFSSFLSLIVSPESANLKLSEYINFWVREFQTTE